MVSPSLLSYHYIHKALPKCPKLSPSEESPFERPNCVPGFSTLTTSEPTPPSTINSLDVMYETQQSHTPSTSGDSGYGTTRKKSLQSNDKAQDMFEALFSPPSSLKMQPKNDNSVPRTETKLSQLFHQKQPKFQTWSTHNKGPSPVKSTSTTLPQKSKRTRRKTDASLADPPSIITQKHKSIGSKSEQVFSPTTPNTATTISPTDTNNNLELLGDDGQVIARYVSCYKFSSNFI